MHHFEIRKIIFGHTKVLTNLYFIDASILPFELCQINKIQMNMEGDIKNIKISTKKGIDEPDDVHTIFPLM